VAREGIGLGGYNFLAMVRRGFFYTFLLLYLRERLGLPATMAALIGAANATASMLGQLLVWGRYSDRTDRRAGLMVRGELLAGVGYLLTFAVYRLTLGEVPPAATLVLVVSCLGTIEFFWSMTDVGYRAAMAQVTTTGTRGRFLGTIELTGLVGLGLGLFLAGLLYRDGRGFEDGSLWFLAAGFILAGVPLIRATLTHLDGVRLDRAPVDLKAPMDPRFLRYLGALGVSVLGLWCFQQNHTYFVRLPDAAGAGDAELSLIRACFWIAGGLTAPLAGALLDRVGARRAYAGSLFLCALVPLLFLPTASVAAAAITLGLFGACLTSFRTASYAYAAELTPEGAEGRHFALYNCVMSLGWGVAALAIGGPVADALIASGHSARTGYAASFVVGTMLGVAGLAVFLGVARPAQRVSARRRRSARSS
jgi:MFS family permease